MWISPCVYKHCWLGHSACRARYCQQHWQWCRYLRPFSLMCLIVYQVAEYVGGPRPLTVSFLEHYSYYIAHFCACWQQKRKIDIWDTNFPYLTCSFLQQRDTYWHASIHETSGKPNTIYCLADTSSLFFLVY